MAAIYFDVDGTLLGFDRPFERIFALACERAGADPVEGAFDTYSAAFFDAFRAFADEPYREGARAAVAEHDLATDAEALAAAMVRAERESTVPRDGVGTALSRLAADHRLGVLSNGLGDIQRGKLDRHGLADRFDAAVFSHEVGALKPAAEPFEAATRRLDADRYVYVADDAETDVRPANAAGFRTVHVVDGGEGRDSPADRVLDVGAFDRLPEVV